MFKFCTKAIKYIKLFLCIKTYINLSQNLTREVFQSKKTYDYHGIDIRFVMIMMIKQYERNDV